MVYNKERSKEMEEQTALANTLKDQNERTEQQAYDSYCKNMLSNKSISALYLEELYPRISKTP